MWLQFIWLEKDASCDQHKMQPRFCASVCVCVCVCVRACKYSSMSWRFLNDSFCMCAVEEEEYTSFWGARQLLRRVYPPFDAVDGIYLLLRSTSTFQECIHHWGGVFYWGVDAVEGSIPATEYLILRRPNSSILAVEVKYTRYISAVEEAEYTCCWGGVYLLLSVLLRRQSSCILAVEGEYTYYYLLLRM